MLVTCIFGVGIKFYIVYLANIQYNIQNNIEIIYISYIMDNQISVNITDFTLEPVIATTIKFSVMELVLNSYVTIQVSFYNANGNPVKHEYVKIEGAEYAAWGTDDAYLTDLVLQKLGLTREVA